MMTPKEIIEFLGKVKFDDCERVTNAQWYDEIQKWTKSESHVYELLHNINQGAIYSIIPPKTYRTYKKVNPEWYGKHIRLLKDKGKFDKKYKIIGIMSGYTQDSILIESLGWHNLRTAFEEYVWEDGTTFGDEI